VIFHFEEKHSDSSMVETIWRNRSESAGPFISVALSHWGMVITRIEGRVRITMRGPETKATQAYCPPDADHFGILFKHGVMMTHLPAGQLKDGMLDLPEAGSDSFWLQGSVWQYPTYENADTFIARLARTGLLMYEPVVDAALRADPQKLSLRSLQRRFLRATGLTRGTLCQIVRARQATLLLQQGVSILDTVDQAGYADQPHLTRSLKYFVGLTPTQLVLKRDIEQLSLISKLQQFS
jgi:AraC-like DNA-binding protein